MEEMVERWLQANRDADAACDCAPIAELYTADEAFFTGTAAEVTPILSIDRRPVGDGTMGPLTAKVRDAYFRAVRDGSAPHPEWRLPVWV